MARQEPMEERDFTFLITSLLILLISLILAAMAYLSFSLGILTPPGASDAPNRVGGATHSGTGVANPTGPVEPTGENSPADVGDIVFPGFVNFSITGGQDFVEMKNSSLNQVYFLITLKDGDGQVLYTSPAIQPGSGEQWKVTDAFDPGTGKHEITASVDAYGVADDTPYTGTITTFTVDMG